MSVSLSVTLGVETVAPLGAQDQTIVKLVSGTAPRRGRRQGKEEGRPGGVDRLLKWDGRAQGLERALLRLG
jgi:hypothetical protein